MTDKQNDIINGIVKNHEFLSDILEGAFFGQSWFSCATHDDTPDEVYHDAKKKYRCASDVWAEVLLNGGWIAVEDLEDETEYKIGLDDVIEGFVTFMLKEYNHYADLMSENADFYTYTALLQCILFGEVIYA